MSKLHKFLDAWFENCGFISVARITGIELNTAAIDDTCGLATEKWNSFNIVQCLRHYKDRGFTDHAYKNQRTFSRSLNRPHHVNSKSTVHAKASREAY